jgi:hypothetical protein
MASTEAQNILVWFQDSLHAATKVICIKFPFAKKTPQGLLNIELTIKAVMFHLFCPNIMSMGFRFSIYTPREHSSSLTRVQMCPKFCKSWWNIQIKHQKILHPSWLNNNGHVCTLPLLPKLGLHLQDPTKCPHKPYIHSTMSSTTIISAWSYLDI